MSEELFASVYVDQCITPILAELLKKRGIDALSCHTIGFVHKNDEEQLNNSIARGRVFITRDKKDFYKVMPLPHKGIIIIQPMMTNKQLSLITEKIVTILNTYTKDEFENLTIFV